MQATVAAAVATPHEPVPHGVLRQFSPTLRPDLAHARLHRSADAHALARLAGAQAFAHGADIVLGPSASDLHGAAGRHLLAHELAHVLHQSPPGGRLAAPRTLFSMKTYVAAMNRKPEPDWATAAEHLNGEPEAVIRQVLKNLSRAYRAKLHEAARTWPGLCSNLGQMTEADYLLERGPAAATGERAAEVCNRPAAPAQAVGSPSANGAHSATGPAALATPPAPTAPAEPSGELTQKDADECSPLYQHKLCIYIVGGFNGDRSGVETPEEMVEYNRSCRKESGYTGPDVGLSAEDRTALKAPRCPRGDPDAARERAAAARLADAIRRSARYMPGGGGEQLLALLTDKVFIGSLVAAVGVYLGLWLFPEPVFTKLAAAATTIAVLSTGVFTVSTIRNLAEAWMDVQRESEAATSDAQVEEAAEHFGKRMGAITVDLIIFLASLLIGGKLPTPRGLPNGVKAIGDAERALAASSEGGVLLQGPWGRVQTVAPSAPVAAPGGAPVVRGSLAVKVQPAPAAPALRLVQPEPALPSVKPNVHPLPLPKPRPAPATALAPSPGAVPLPPLVPGTQPGVLPQTQSQPQARRRPPFVLRLPQQKAPHLATYRAYLGVLQSDPNYQRGDPAQLSAWHMALRLGGSHGIPAEVYERGHRMGFVGEEGERRIRVPNWSRTASKPMEVDHIIELQVTPLSMRGVFNEPDNFELLDRAANGSSGSQLSASIAAERAIQVAHDPSLANAVIPFDSVVMAGGFDGERWSIDAIRAGQQLDYYENHHAP